MCKPGLFAFFLMSTDTEKKGNLLHTFLVSIAKKTTYVVNF